MLMEVNTLVNKNSSNKKNLYKKHKRLNTLSLTKVFFVSYYCKNKIHKSGNNINMRHNYSLKESKVLKKLEKLFTFNVNFTQST